MQPLEVDLFVDLAYNFLTAGRDAADRARAGTSTRSTRCPTRAGSPIARAPAAHAGRRRRGPDTTDGPGAGHMDGHAPRRATASRRASPSGTPAGQRWFLKFDPPGYRAMATGTEVAVTKLMWALGYNVPENHIAYLRREQLVRRRRRRRSRRPAATAAPMRGADIDRLLARADREPDGSYRVVASKALAGKPVGRIRFVGTRPDDPNDIVPHEDRRELRGYGVFAAWLNHVDAKAINSLDTLVTEGGRIVRPAPSARLRIERSAAAASRRPTTGRGTSICVEPRAGGAQMVGLGFWRAGRGRRRPFYESPAIGRLAARQHATSIPTAGSRACRTRRSCTRAPTTSSGRRSKLAALTDRHAAGGGARRRVRRSRRPRRSSCARLPSAATPSSAPTCRPSIRSSIRALDDDGRLTFRNAAVDADVAHAPAGYRAAWSTFDNTTGRTEPIGITSGPGTVLPVPEALVCTPGEFVRVDLSSVGSARPAWRAPETVYFRLTVDGWQLVALTRSAAAQ